MCWSRQASSSTDGWSAAAAVHQRQEATAPSESCSGRPRLRSARFSDTNIVRTYSSQEIIERDPSISDFKQLEMIQFDEAASVLKEHDGPAVVSGLVDHLIRTLFNR